MDAVGGQQAAAHGLETLALAHHLLTLPGEGPLAFLVLGRHPHHAEGFAVTAHVAVQPLAEGQGIEPVVLHALALLVPVLGLHHVVGHAHFR